MSRRITAEELLQIFQNLDRDGNGVVSRAELERGLQRAGVNPNSIQVSFYSVLLTSLFQFPYLAGVKLPVCSNASKESHNCTQIPQ